MGAGRDGSTDLWSWCPCWLNCEMTAAMGEIAVYVISKRYFRERCDTGLLGSLWWSKVMPPSRSVCFAALCKAMAGIIQFWWMTLPLSSRAPDSLQPQVRLAPSVFLSI